MSPASLLHTFADETGVFGPHLFTHRRSTFESIFWCTFVAVFACYTTKSLVLICVQYADEETITDVRHTKKDGFFFPDPILYFTAQASPQAKSLPFGELLKEFEETGHLAGNSFWRALSFFYNLHKRESLSISSPKSPPTAEKLTDELREALAAFPSRPGLLSNFSDFLFVKLCRAFRPKISFRSEDKMLPGTPTCSRENIMIKHVEGVPEMVCVFLNIDAGRFIYRGGGDKLIIAMNFTAESLRRDVGVERAWAWFALDGHYYLGGGEQISITDYDSEVQIPMSANLRFYARLNAVYRNLDLRRRRCEPDRRRSAFCDGTCRSAYFLDVYACWPTMFVPQLHQNATKGRRCDAIDYLKSTDDDAARRASEKLADCRRRCFPACDKPVFAITADGSSTTGELTVANVFVQSFVYTQIEEKLANDLEGLLSSFGGTLGLWLGASFAAIVHIVVFMGKSIIDILARKRRRTGIEEATIGDMSTQTDELLFGACDECQKKLQAEEKDADYTLSTAAFIYS